MTSTRSRKTISLWYKTGRSSCLLAKSGAPWTYSPRLMSSRAVSRRRRYYFGGHLPTWLRLSATDAKMKRTPTPMLTSSPILGSIAPWSLPLWAIIAQTSPRYRQLTTRSSCRHPFPGLLFEIKSAKLCSVGWAHLNFTKTLSVG